MVGNGNVVKFLSWCHLLLRLEILRFGVDTKLTFASSDFDGSVGVGE